jgi:hypothetical protein
MKRRTFHMLSAGFLIALCCFGIIGCDALKTGADDQSHGTVRTRYDINSLQFLIRQYAGDYKELPADYGDDGIVKMNARGVFQKLARRSPHEEDYFLAAPVGTRWVKFKSTVDRWGNDLNFRVAAKKNSQQSNDTARVYSIAIWSNGPNGKNENGKGDDIAAEAFVVELNSTRQP